MILRSGRVFGAPASSQPVAQPSTPPSQPVPPPPAPPATLLALPFNPRRRSTTSPHRSSPRRHGITILLPPKSTPAPALQPLPSGVHHQRGHRVGHYHHHRAGHYHRHHSGFNLCPSDRPSCIDPGSVVVIKLHKDRCHKPHFMLLHLDLDSDPDPDPDLVHSGCLPPPGCNLRPVFIPP